MNKMNGDFVDLKAFNGDSLLFEIVTSQDNSAYNSFANDDMEVIPSEFERNYFEEMSKVLGDEMEEDDVDDFIEQKYDSPFQLHNDYEDKNPFEMNIFEMSMIDSLTLCPMNIGNNINQEKIPNSLYNVPTLFETKQDTVDLKDKLSLKWRTQPCAFYQANGFCKKGDKCNFSHEIQHQPSTKPFVPADQLYRTKPCHFFFTQGVCRKGENCNFSHDRALFEKLGGQTAAPDQQ